MFCNSVFNQDISQWEVSNVQYMELMFYDSKFEQNIEKWNIKEVLNMKNIFNKETSLIAPYWSKYETKKERIMAYNHYFLKNKINCEIKENIIKLPIKNKI